MVLYFLISAISLYEFALDVERLTGPLVSTGHQREVSAGGMGLAGFCTQKHLASEPMCGWTHWDLHVEGGQALRGF